MLQQAGACANSGLVPAIRKSIKGKRKRFIIARVEGFKETIQSSKLRAPYIAFFKLMTIGIPPRIRGKKKMKFGRVRLFLGHD